MCVFFFFQAEDGIRDLVRSRGLGDVYKRQLWKAFSSQKEKLDDDAFAELLSSKVHQSVADVMLKWDD